MPYYCCVDCTYASNSGHNAENHSLENDHQIIEEED
jgi:hypothetical protein